MAIVVVGLNHKTAPIVLLERLAISEQDLPKALHQLETYEHILEGAVLSTCNRIEVYAAVSKFHGGAQDVRNFLAEFCHVPPEDFSDHLHAYHEDGATRHLFRVAAGIDSMIVGESEILGQVRRAYQAASDQGMVGRLLGTAFRRALRVGKRARSETAIGRNPASMSSAAVELARRAFEPETLAGKQVAIVGAGKMGRLAARALAQAGPSRVVIVNRSEDRARRLAEDFSASVRSLDELEGVLTVSDIVICSTTAPRTVIDRPLAERALGARSIKSPLLVIDIAVPHDVEPAAGEVPGFVLRDIEDLRGVVESSVGSRVGEISKVEEIIAAEMDMLVRWERAGEFAPTAAELVQAADVIRRRELERIGARLEAMSPEERSVIDHLTRRIVAKILHTPLTKARELANSKQGYVYLTALRELFELDDES